MGDYVVRDIVQNEKNRQDVGVMNVPLPNIGGCTEMVLKISCTNGVTNNLTNPIRGVLKDIKVVDGNGKNVVAASAYDLYALATLRRKQAPYISESDVGGAVQVVHLPISFSTTRDNQNIGLNLVKGSEPHIELNLDLAAVNACGDTGFVSKSLSVTIEGRVTESAGSPGYSAVIGTRRGMGKKTSIANPDRLNLGAGNDLLGIYLYAFKSGIDDSSLIRRVRLIVNGTEKAIIDQAFVDLQRSKPLLNGNVVTSYAQVMVSPYRYGEGPAKVLSIGKAELLLEELVADGDVRVLVESLDPA